MLAERIAAVLGVGVVRTTTLSAGAATVTAVDLADGERIVAKHGGGTIEAEGWMLGYLARHSRLPVPRVLHVEPDLLLMTWVEARGSITPAAESHAAELLAALHGIEADAYGLERDTAIGGLVQPNAPDTDWVAFFRDRRLLHMAREAEASGRLPAETRLRIERLCDGLEALIGPPAPPALIHGDMWAGNVLVAGDRIAAFIDPALYYADPEIELAFTSLFSTFGEPFLRRYDALRPLRPGFLECRRDLYNLWPLLVHVRLFGGGYVGAVERTLGRYGA